MSDRETIAVYAAKAADYAAMGMADGQDRAMAAFTDGLPKGGAILDLGCGPGLHGAAFIEQGFAVAGLDATPEFVAAARARGLKAELGTFADLDAVAEYDGVWASFSLLHAARVDFPRLLHLAVRALKRGGHLHLGMKTGTDDYRDALGRLYGFHTVAELHGHLEAEGMTVIWEETGEGAGLSGSVDPFVLLVATHA